MKREILFKIKVILTNEGKSFYNNKSEFIESVIHNVTSLSLIHKHCVIENKESVITIFESYCEIYELMQFTGLLDKNGVKIFEGDICDGGYEVRYDDGSYGLCYYKENVLVESMDQYICGHIEIIGNIHDRND